MNPLFYLVPAILIVNIPCGYWREGLRRFSFLWFVAVHLPVPFIAVARHMLAIEPEWHNFGMMIGAYFTGQFIGAKLRMMKK
ncbi:MAG: hypothetical protein K9M45_04700 [Kiritimatiellales bacterium]|nr:hypothetical protein [Kiritimatiellales bacterium]